MLKRLYAAFCGRVAAGADAALLAVRLMLAYGFFEPALNKWRDIEGTAAWFGESLEMPFPLLNTFLAAGTEALGVVLLTLGLATRLIALSLMVVMGVAIVTVHLGNGFSCGNNGFEIPFYYLLFLIVLLTNGAGRYSLDRKLGL
ncbi:MAG: DoxX family protein [Campylobacterales bacterium]